jgi:hypothetical protein
MTSPATLSFGDSGDAVVFAQRQLNVADGFRRSMGLAPLDDTPLAEDGLFGPRTRAAVSSFQGLTGLAVDGVIGAETSAGLLAGVDPPSSLAYSNLVPPEGLPRLCISLSDINGATTGQQIAVSDVSGLSSVVVTAGQAAPVTANWRPEVSRLYFTLGPQQPGPVDISIGDGQQEALATLPQFLTCVTQIPVALGLLHAAIVAGIQETAVNAATLEVGRLQAYADGCAAALDSYDAVGTAVTARLADNPAPDPADIAAWTGHMATRARISTDVVNEQARLTLGADPIAALDGMPFAGADDQPTWDQAALVLLATATENVIIPGAVDLTA